MSNSPVANKALLFLNNLAGDDLWEQGHLMLPKYEPYSAPTELFPYKDKVKAASPSGGLHVMSVPYNLLGHGTIQLYGFPFLPFFVEPFTLEYPLPIQGLVITQDMRLFDYFTEQDPIFRVTADPYLSRLAWAKAQNLPTILAVHHAAENAGNTEKLTKLVGMELFCPVVWHRGEVNPDFLQKCVGEVLSVVKQKQLQ
jgi:hypothetical protein